MNKSMLMLFLVVPLVVILMMSGQKGGCSRPTGATMPADAELVRIDADSSILADSGISAPSLRILAEVARTQQARAAGLVGRSYLMPGHGMLYIFDEPAVQEFSEAGTGMELSTAFLTDDGTIVALVDTVRNDTKLNTCDTPVRLVLQLRRGWFADRGIAVGARLLLPGDLFAASAPPPVEPEPEPEPDTAPQPDTDPQ
jgi:uncharacterized membrane protein (UPF0127 family)